MSKDYVLDLNRIKSITQPLTSLQNGLGSLSSFVEQIEQSRKDIHEINSLDLDKQQINQLLTLLQEFHNEITKITNKNINNFLTFQGNLLKKYREQYKDHLIRLKIDQEKSRNLGLYLIAQKKISKVDHQISYVNSIILDDWFNLLDSLNQNSIFLNLIHKIRDYYRELTQNRLKMELEKIPEEFDIVIKNEFKNAFNKDPDLSFEQFFNEYEKLLTAADLSTRRELLQRVKEKEELEKLKLKQAEQKQGYKDYLKLSAREFERQRRKKSREKLSEIDISSNTKEELEISEEVSEKIELFKSQFEKRFQDDYLIGVDQEQDPLDLIRERKKMKAEEFKKFKKHFDQE
ncbi:MAG: hypothetical protein MUP85_22915 [Candidatus Lokiarchaeota archaeon]|nr:hypothetical protein [Candidatus Lokiarchaeota archaeon]